MSKKDINLNFKRGISQTSSGSGGASAISNGHADLNHKKKTSKLRQGSDYMMSKGQVPGITSQNNLDKASENVAGGMSVTDIELTMSEKEESSLPQQQSPRSKDQVSGGAHATLAGSGFEGDISRNTKKLSLKSLPTKCFDPLCNSCIWHCYVLKRPDRVQWMAKTVRVELKRQRDRAWPGFDHKLKQNIKKDEIYVIVTNIARDGIASGSGLCVGDLILSVNNIPLQMDKMSSIDFRKNDSLIFQIQHPEALSPDKAGKCFDKLSSSGSSRVIPPETERFMQQPPTPSSSPIDAFVNHMSPDNENIPLSQLKKTTPETCQPLPQATIFVCGNSATEFVNCFVGDRINSFVQLNSCAFCFGLSLKLTLCSAFSSTSCVTIDNWESFSYLFRENKERAQENSSVSMLSCINVRLVVVEDDNFFLNCCPWMFSSSSVFILTFDTNRLLASSEAEMLRLTKIASAVRTGMSNHRTVYDGAAGSIPQTFSPVMPGPTTVVSNHPYLMMVGVETFQASDHEEIRALFYTSLGEALPRPDVIPVKQGHMCSEMMSFRQHIFSVLNGHSSNIAGHLPASPISAMLPGGMQSATFSHLVANTASSQGSQRMIGYSTSVALDIISGHPSLTISQKELLKILQEYSPSPLFEGSFTGTNGLTSSSPLYMNGNRHGSPHQESVFGQVVEDLRNSRNLILSDSLNIGCRSEGDKEFVLPTILFDKILRLAQKVVAGGLTDAQHDVLRYLNARGIVSRPEMAELLSLVSSHPEKLLLCLDELRVTFSVRSGQHQQQQEADSGFDDGLSVLFPYFKEDLPFDSSSLDGFDEHWTIQFSEEVQLSSFYCILSELSLRWPPGLDLSMQSQLVAQVLQQQQVVALPGGQHQLQPTGVIVYYVCFQQVANQIQAFKKRNSSHGTIPPTKESQMTEHQLSVANVISVATRHVSASTRLWQLQRSQPQAGTSSSLPSPLVVTSLPTLRRRRYSGDFQVALPAQAMVDEDDEQKEPEGAMAVPACHLGEYEAQVQMMRTRVDQLSL
ncbi:hypothetical protein ElyMa_005568500 [Elysia marginata]|uniref:PDZ domain-containing protein n=1 Tax=Elysia marginata TaxID=1093978 RepID=A0AAV4F0D1_9GAST|nr:hypothetical protein ElyMa_005568500 [Elysia marginata]